MAISKYQPATPRNGGMFGSIINLSIRYQPKGYPNQVSFISEKSESAWNKWTELDK